MDINIDDYNDSELADVFNILPSDDEEQIKLKLNNYSLNSPHLNDFFKQVEERLVLSRRPETHIPTTQTFITDTKQDGVLNPTMRTTIDQCIVIDSQYRKESYNVNSFTCDLNCNVSNVLALRLFSVQLPNSITFLIQSSNCSLWFNNTNINSFKISIPTGNYTDGLTLVNELNTAIGVVIFSFNTLNQSVSIVPNSNNIIIPSLGTTATSINWTQPFSSNNFNSSLGYILGFRNHQTPLLNVEVQAQASVDLAPYKYIYICLNDYTTSCGSNYSIGIGNNISGSIQSVNTNCSIQQQQQLSIAPNYINNFAVLPIQYSNQSIISYSSSFIQRFKRVYFGPVNINRVSFSLYDDKGNLLDMHGRDWSITLMAELLYQY
jgi:hypothetical protein